MNKKQKTMLWRILIAAALMVILHFAVKAWATASTSRYGSFCT